MAGGGISSLLDISQRALSANTQAIRVIGTNVANVNTPGFSRRKVNLVTERPVAFGQDDAAGTGVQVNDIVRQTDQYLNNELLARVADRTKQDARQGILARAEEPFALDSTGGKIGSQLSEFFSALDDLSLNPSDQALRNKVIQQGQSLTQSVNSAYNSLAQLQREADDRIRGVLSDVNTTTAAIADINRQIPTSEANGQQNLTLRDTRDQLLNHLAEKISFQKIMNSDGTESVVLNNGLTLVSGSDSRNLEFTTAPSFAPVGGFPPGLDGGALGHIVYDFDKSSLGTSHVELSNILAAGGGEIGGLLGVRGVQALTDTTAFDAVGDIIDLASQVEGVARDLLLRFNSTYLGNVDENTITPAVFDASSGDLNGNSPNPFGLFSFPGAPLVTANGLPNLSDLTASGFPSLANRITFQVSDPNNLAAAQDLNPVSGVKSFAPGDATNIQALAALRNTAIDYSLYGVGTLSGTTTIEKLYQLTVSAAGTKSQDAKNQFSVAKDRESQVQEFQQSISGVSLDEEFAQLINFQRAFEASARIVRVGDELTQQILGLLG